MSSLIRTAQQHQSFAVARSVGLLALSSALTVGVMVAVSSLVENWS
jgi:hypothetical protein